MAGDAESKGAKAQRNPRALWLVVGCNAEIVLGAGVRARNRGCSLCAVVVWELLSFAFYHFSL